MGRTERGRGIGYHFLATDQHICMYDAQRLYRHGGASVRGRRYPLIIFASGVKDLDRPSRCSLALISPAVWQALSRSLSEPLAATAVWEYSHYPLDIQMKAKPDHGMDLSGKCGTKGTEVFR